MTVTNKPDKLWRHDIRLDRFFKRFNGEINEDGKYNKDKLSKFELEEVDVIDLEIGETYINIDGHSLMCLDITEDGASFKFISRSPLNIYRGYDILGLEYGNQWNLFWILVKSEERGFEKYGI
jgi:hypothetical protein